MPRTPLVLLLALPLVAAACGGTDTQSASTTAPTTAAAPAAAADTTGTGAATEMMAAELGVAASTYGQTIVDTHGQALYLFDADKTPTSTCYGACATAWPPLLTHGAPSVTGGLDGAKLGTTRRTDGSLQVTYNGHPLYYYRGDAPGVIKCQHANADGGLWLIVQPSGVPNMST